MDVAFYLKRTICRQYEVFTQIFFGCRMIRRNELDQFIKRLVTGDEKWITYKNIKQKRLWSRAGQSSQKVAEPALTIRNVLLSVLWEWKEATPMWQDA